MERECFIVDAVRTPIGSFGGALSGVGAVDLGVVAVKKLAERFSGTYGGKGGLAGITEECNFGNVVSAGLGQAPARQIAIKSGFPVSVRCCTLNKLCGSGMEAVRLGANSILAGEADTAVCGGIESMSNNPYLLKGARFGWKLGHVQALDILLNDGLLDAFSGRHMGVLTEGVARKHGVTREQQDEYAVDSYKKARAAAESGVFESEICPVEIPDKKKPVVVSKDEEPLKVDFAKIPALRPVFDKEGTITAANASKLNDGAAAVLLMSGKKAEELKIRPRARILAFSSVSLEPELFSIAPVEGIKLLYKKLGVKQDYFGLYEINEAFSASSVIINRELGLDGSKVNVHGGAVAMGHPIGASGARIIATLINAMEKKNVKRGVASLCIGGGEALSVAIELN